MHALLACPAIPALLVGNVLQLTRYIFHLLCCVEAAVLLHLPYYRLAVVKEMRSKEEDWSSFIAGILDSYDVGGRPVKRSSLNAMMTRSRAYGCAQMSP
jgi:hypothetical protein